MAACGHCGANLTPADMSLPSCRYCGTVLAHYASAAEKVAVVNAMMGDANRNGIPDALEGMARLGGGHGPPPGGPLPPGARPVISGGAVMIAGGPLPPTTGGPVGGGPVGGGPVGAYGAYGYRGGPDMMAHARRGMNTIMIVSIVAVVGLMVVVGLAIAGAAYWMR